MSPTSPTRARPPGADFDGDGQLDLYVGFTRRSAIPNKLYRNDGNGKHFTEVGKAMGADPKGETRQPAWIDFDRDGDVDFFVAVRQVVVLDRRGRHTQAGSEVRIYAVGSRKVLETAIVDTGSGYCSQNVAPVHFGLPSYDRVNIEVTALTSAGPQITRVPGITPDKARWRVVLVKTE